MHGVSVLVPILLLYSSTLLQSWNIHTKRTKRSEESDLPVNLFLDVNEDIDFQKLININCSSVEEMHLRMYVDIYEAVSLPPMNVLSTLYIELDQRVTMLPLGLFPTLPALKILYIYPMDEAKRFVSDETAPVEPDVRKFVLKNDIFDGLNSLQELTISTVGLETIEINSMDGLNELLILDFSKNQLNHFNSKLLKNCCKKLTQITLESNQLSDVNFGENNKIPIRHKKSRISSQLLADDDKDQMMQLEILDMHNNLIKKIHTLSFGDAMINLEELNLSQNQIDHIDSFSFAKLSSLKKLFLQSNRIKILHSTALFGLKSLIKLNLSSNDIKIIETGTFSELVALKELNLSHNKLDYINPGTFDGLHKLRTLDLSQNQLQVLEVGLLRGLQSLPNQGDTELRHLNLGNNNITKIMKDSLLGLHNLKELFIDHNLLTHLDPSDAGLNRVPQKLWLHRNPWHCRCYLLPLIDWLNSNAFTSNHTDSKHRHSVQNNLDTKATCSVPKNLENIELVHSRSYFEKECDTRVTSPSNRSKSTSLFYIQTIVLVLPLFSFHLISK